MRTASCEGVSICKLTGERPTERYLKDAMKLADLILAGGFEELAGVPCDVIMMKS